MGKDAHMRKDVKLGFAIGGVLLAVLIVYVLVVPGGRDKRLSSATGEDGTQQADGGAGVSLEPVVPPPATQPSGTGVAQVPPAAPPSTFTPPPGGTDPLEQPKGDDASAAVAKSGDAKSRDLDWSKLLNDSQMLMVTPENKTAVTPVTSSAGGKSTNTQIA